MYRKARYVFGEEGCKKKVSIAFVKEKVTFNSLEVKVCFRMKKYTHKTEWIKSYKRIMKNKS